jgi:beta-glucanase (GH16 family)
VGAYCLGGCDPRSSFNLSSCTPAPICQSKTYTWDNLDNVQPNTKYLGNASAADWVSSGQPLVSGGSLILTMAPNTVGTLLANNHYVWYGKISAKLKTSRGQGVVTAFILLSDVKDEIDWEFVGTELTTAQTNYYFQGELVCK